MYSLWQVWALVVMFLSKKYNRLPHFFTINLIFAQVSTPPHASQAEPLNIYLVILMQENLSVAVKSCQ